MRPYEAPDFYGIDALLTEEERMIRDTVREWVSERWMPVVEHAYRDGRFPTDLIPGIAGMGLLGGNLDYADFPRLGSVAYGLCMQELERGDSGLRSFVSVQGALVMYPIYAYGSEEQRRKWLPQLAAGTKIGCFGLTEPDFGSNPAGMKTTAKTTSDGYVLNGAKMWITNGTIADVAVVWGRLDGGAIRGFLVEKGTKGFTAPEQKRKHSLRASVTSELILQDVHVPKDAILPNGEGLKAPLGCLTQARYGISWGVLGSAMACFHAAVEYSKVRIMFDGPIARFQLIQGKLADMITEITKGQLLALQVGRLKEKKLYTPEMVSMAKRNNCEIALDIAREARDILGANGITGEYPVMRHMCNLESVKTYEGTHSIHTLVIGEAVTGIPAYR